MATTFRNICGFETADTGEASTTSGSPAVNTTAPVRSGLYSLKLTGAATAATFTLPAGYTTGVAATITDTYICIGFGFRTSDTTPAAIVPIVAGQDSGTTKSAGLSLATNGDLLVRNAADSTVATITNPFVNDTWYYLELLYRTDASGAYECWIDGARQANGTAVDFLNSFANIATVKFSGGSASDGNIVIDDVYIITDGAALPVPYGPSQVLAYQPGLNSGTPDTGSALNTGTWILAGENPTSGAVGHIAVYTASTVNGRVAFNDANSGGQGPGPSGGAYTVAGTIQAGKWMYRAKKGSSGTGGVQLYYGDGGSNANTLSIAATTSSAPYHITSNGAEVPASNDVFWGGFGTTGTVDATLDDMWGMLLHTPIFIEQRSSRFYLSNADEASSTPIGAENTNSTFEIGKSSYPLFSQVVVQLRIQLRNRSSAPTASTSDYRLQWALNGGAFSDVVTVSGGVRGLSAGLTNNAATTDRSTNGISDPADAAFVAGEQSTDGLIDDVSLTGGHYTEHAWDLIFIDTGADTLFSGDVLTFGVMVDGVACSIITNVPTITINNYFYIMWGRPAGRPGQNLFKMIGAF